MSKYKPYPKYKESGVAWLGEVPEGWEISKLKYLCRITTGNKDTENKVDNGKYPFYVRSQTVEKINSYSFNGEAILTAGDGAGVGKVFHYTNGKFDFHQRVYLFYSFKNVDGKFLFEYIKNNFYKVALAGVAKSTVDSLRLPLIQNFMITVPSLKEQLRVSNYLDQKTKKIDTLIKKQQTLIKLLKEKRQALISHAVTKGLDDAVEMKDSGVAWLGDVPLHWEIGLLSSLFTNNKEKNCGMKNNNLLSLSYGRIIQKNIDTSFGLLPANFESYQIVHNGYIILRLTDLQNDKKSLRVGFVNEKGIITSAYVGLAKKSESIGNEKYFYYYLHSFDIHKGFYGMGAGVRQGLNFDELKKLRITLPPINEQNKIVEYIEIKTNQIDTLITKSTQAIELLKERRTALISAVVTGKVDVRKENYV